MPAIVNKINSRISKNFCEKPSLVIDSEMNSLPVDTIQSRDLPIVAKFTMFLCKLVIAKYAAGKRRCRTLKKNVQEGADAISIFIYLY